MMIALGYILAILPAALILYLTNKKFGPSEILFFIGCILLGALSTLPAFQFERLEFLFDQENLNQGWSLFTTAFLLVGFGEELFKFTFLLGFAFWSKKIVDLKTGVLYAIAIGMGFALLENILYAFRFPVSTMAVRTFTAVPAHGVFAIITGYFVGMAFSQKRIVWILAFRGLLFASLLHGIYDWLILQSYYDWLTGLAIPILGIGFFYAFWLIQYAEKNTAPVIVEKE